MSLVEMALAKMQRARGRQAVGSASRGRPDSGPDSDAPRDGKSAKSREFTKLGGRIALDVKALRDAGLLPPEHQERQIADQYRQIKRPLVDAALRSGPDAVANAQLIMVSSAMPGDGKTFTAINLALSLAKERDFSVVLVDADVAKQHVSRLLGVGQAPGLLDALRDESIRVDSLIVSTDVPGLYVLPAGGHSEAATELLASQRMKKVMRELRGDDSSRIVLIDSPPLLVTSEARALADTVGQVVAVVRAGKTSQQNLREALSCLNAGRQSIGLVLNQSLTPSAGYYYGYGDRPESPAGAA